MKKLIIFIFLVAIVGCKVETNVSVSTAQLTAENPEPISADLYIEIPSCSDYEDSRNESDSLAKVKSQIPQTFKGAVFKDCFTKQMETFAQFEIPVGITKKSEDHKEDLNLYSHETVLLGVSAKPDFIERLKKLEQSNLVSSDYYMFFDVEFIDSYDATIYSAYLNGEPATVGSLNIPKDSTANISLSNVSIHQLLSRGFVAILMYD